MRRFNVRSALGWALCCLLVTYELPAQEHAVPADLPITDVVRSWLAQDADVLEADAGKQAGAQQARELRVSPNEWSVKYNAAQRRYPAGGPQSKEWTAQLERPIRLPNKMLIDRRLADTAEALALARYGEALHESARSLVDLWLGWQEAIELERLLDEQVRVAQENVRSVAARLRSGDAARLELNLAEADLADAQRRASEAHVERGKARSRFEIRFPGNASEPPRPAEPIAISGSLESWRSRILEQSDELKIAQLEAEAARSSAARARADRLPDPTVGVYTASEIFSSEKVVGLSVTVPIPGRYRSARAGRALSEAHAAEARLTRVQRELDAKVADTYMDAVGSHQRWQLAQSAAVKADESARLTQRAYSLGEADVQAVIVARRQALEAAIAAVQARVAARLSHHHLLVDGHLIWDLDHD